VGPVSVANKPMTKEPLTFTRSVPQGKVSPNRLATKAEAPQRARLPRPPPMKIQSPVHIVLQLPETKNSVCSGTRYLSASIQKRNRRKQRKLRFRKGTHLDSTTKTPLTPALSPSDGKREKMPESAQCEAALLSRSKGQDKISSLLARYLSLSVDVPLPGRS